jgi:hypothetical protein
LFPKRLQDEQRFERSHPNATELDVAVRTFGEADLGGSLGLRESASVARTTHSSGG